MAAQTQTRQASAHVQRLFSSRPERVFDALLDPAMIRRWFGPGLGEIVRVEVSAHVDGMFSIAQQRGDAVVETYGTYREMSRPHRLVFTWTTRAARFPEGLVLVELTPHMGGTSIAIVHEVDPSWPERVREIETEWTRMLDALADTLGYPACDDPSIDAPG